MRDLGGALELLGDVSSGWRIKNGTDLTFKDVGVLRRTDSGMQSLYLPELKAGSSMSVQFRDVQSPWIPEWDSTAVMARVTQGAEVSGELRLGRFAELAVEQLRMRPGEVRLIAWTPHEIDGIRYTPDAPQVNGVSFVLAHLKKGALPPAEKDQNLLLDVNKPNVFSPDEPDPMNPNPAAPGAASGATSEPATTPSPTQP
jgi:hypothetical protein